MSPKLTLAIATLALCACNEPQWSRVQSGLDEGLVSVWGRSRTDIYAVGGDVGAGPIVLHFDGSRWTRLATGTTGDLWWVNGAEEGPVYFGGAGGTILRYDGSTFERMTTPASTGTVFGVWAATPDDVWAVGGTFANAGFVWHLVDGTWTALTVPDLNDRGFFKVWGNSSSDVTMVGAMGAMYHWNGAELTALDAGTTRTLFTVHVDGERGTAVGGAGTAALVELQGGVWVDRSPALTAQLFGVWLTPDAGYAVGMNGLVMRRTADGWVDEPTNLGFITALHAVWVDEADEVWAVGGQIVSSPLTDGVLIHFGLPVNGTGIVEEGS